MANVQIYQLDNAGSDLDNSALLAMDIPNPDTSAASEVPYVTRKASVSELETQMLQTEEYSTALDTTRKTITGAINENKSVIGYAYDAYDATTAYSTGDLCIYNNVLYKAKQATTGNLPTNTTYWEPTSISDEIGELKSASEYQVGDTITASIYKHCSGRTTNAGDKVLFFYPTAKPINQAVQNAEFIVANGNCYTSAGAIALKIGTYTGQITDGGIYFLIDLVNAFTDGGRCATVEMQTRTITFS